VCHERDRKDGRSLNRRTTATYDYGQKIGVDAKKKRPTPWLTERISRCSSPLVRDALSLKTKAAGRRTAMTLIVNKEEFNWVAPKKICKDMAAWLFWKFSTH
jgi:hypothetical protein